MIYGAEQQEIARVKTIREDRDEHSDERKSSKSIRGLTFTLQKMVKWLSPRYDIINSSPENQILWEFQSCQRNTYRFIGVELLSPFTSDKLKKKCLSVKVLAKCLFFFFFYLLSSLINHFRFNKFNKMMDSDLIWTDSQNPRRNLLTTHILTDGGVNWTPGLSQFGFSPENR